MTTANYSVSPGEYVREYMEDNGLSLEEFTARTGLSEDQVRNVIKDNPDPLTLIVAEGLSRGSYCSVRALMNYERQYRKEQE